MRWQLIAGLLMPYLAVWLGLYVFQSAWVAIFGYHLGILSLVTWARAWPGREAFRPHTTLWQTLLFGLTGGAAGLAVYFLWPSLHVSPALAETLLDWGLTPRAWPVFIAYSALINPWLEEVYWRGWLGRADRRLVFQDAAFAGFHLLILAPFFPVFWLAAAFLVLAFSGWLWRQASLLGSSLFHLAADVSILVAVWSVIS